MGIRRSTPYHFTPVGLSDASDASDAFKGACQELQNLIFDHSNPGCVISRPGTGVALADFSLGWNGHGAAAAAFISIHVGLGTRIYGLIASTTNTGKDEPFCYDKATAAFVTVSGATSGNTPTSPATSGDWIPPTMAVIGTKIMVTHQGFSGANKIGWIDIANPAAPAWSAGDTSVNALPSKPLAVANYNNRAYYACGNLSFYSDDLNPLLMTNAGQALTHGDTTPITGYSGLPVATSTAGVIPVLVVFKATQIWQVTGDASIMGSLAQTYLSLSEGTSAPRSIVQTPNGIYFMGTDGAMVVDQFGLVRSLKHPKQEVADLRIPFINATTPSRMAGSFLSNIYRLCMDTIVKGQAVTNDYWLDTTAMRWNGPHTHVYDCCSVVGDTFILSSAASPGKLFAETAVPEINSSYDDDGIPVSVSLTTCAFPKTGHMQEVQVVESTQELSAFGEGITYLLTATNDLGELLSSCAITVIQAMNIWGANHWGDGSRWSAGINEPHVYNAPWLGPLVFQKMVLNIRSNAVSSLMIGSFAARYQDTGYTNYEG